MRVIYIKAYVIASFLCALVVGHSLESNKCLFGNDTKNNEVEKFMTAISPLVGQNFVTEKNGIKYTVSICNDVSKLRELGSVVTTEADEYAVLGRRNDTHLISGDNWMVLWYGSGDLNAGKKLQRKAFVYFVCDPDGSDGQEKLQLVEDDKLIYRFIIETGRVCSSDESSTGWKLFFIIVAASLSVYCLIGALYKRYVHNARHCQQMPHFKFWSAIGSSLADGCNYVCRCDSEMNSWNNIVSNYNSADRDDALLQP